MDASRTFRYSYTAVWLLALVAILLNLLDLATTFIGLDRGFHEANIISRTVISQSQTAYVFIKLFLVTYLLLPVKHSPIGIVMRKALHAAFGAYSAIIVFSAYVVASNVSLLL